MTSTKLFPPMIQTPGEALLSFADDLKDMVIEELGAENILSIFLSGSVASGDAAGAVIEGCLEVYSDVDVYVVVRDGMDMVRSRGRVTELVGRLGGSDYGCKMFATPDVGVFSLSDLKSQPVRPGTVDIAGAHRMLFGDEDVALLSCASSPQMILPAEALYLLEHRLMETADLRGRPTQSESGGMQRYAGYLALKSGLDAASAALIVFGRYVPSRAERIHALSEPTFEQDRRTLVPDDAMELVLYCQRCLGDLGVFLGATGEALSDLGGRVDAMLLDVWERAARRILKFHGESFDDLLARRAATGTLPRHFRELLVIARRLSVPRFTVAARGVRLSRLSPTAALRLCGVADTHNRREFGADPPGVNRVSKEYVAFVDDLTRVFRFTGGGVYERARNMYRAIA